MIDDGIFESLYQLADSERAKELTASLILCEKLRGWLETTPEGKLLTERIMVKYESAISDFESCGISDVQAMTEAKLQISACKLVTEIFNQVFIDAENAKNELLDSE